MEIARIKDINFPLWQSLLFASWLCTQRTCRPIFPQHPTLMWSSTAWLTAAFILRWSSRLQRAGVGGSQDTILPWSALDAPQIYLLPSHTCLLSVRPHMIYLGINSHNRSALHSRLLALGYRIRFRAMERRQFGQTVIC